MSFHTPRTPTADLVFSLRRHLRLTQRAFAAFLGVSQFTISQWELGNIHPSGPNLLRLQDLLFRHSSPASQGGAPPAPTSAGVVPPPPPPASCA